VRLPWPGDYPAPFALTTAGSPHNFCIFTRYRVVGWNVFRRGVKSCYILSRRLRLAVLVCALATASVRASEDACRFVGNPLTECAGEVWPQDELTDVAPASVDYSGVKKCKMWWWAEYARAYHYEPLTQWSDNIQDALTQKLDMPSIVATIGYAPLPPRPKINENTPPTSTCSLPKPEQERALIEKLRNLNLRNFSQDMLDTLVAHCFAFEVGTAVWRRIASQVVGSYILTLGDINIIILAKPRFSMLASAASPSTPGDAISYTAVGACPIDKDPRLCVEEYFINPEATTHYGFPETWVHHMSALPFRTDLQGLFLDGATAPRTIEMVLTANGTIGFLELRENAEPKSLPITLYHGQLALQTTESFCDPKATTRNHLMLRPLALGDRIQKYYRKIAVYQPADFPPADLAKPGMVERGCGEPIPVSEWAAKTANALKHVGRLGFPLEAMYRAAANERFKHKIKEGGWRNSRAQSIYGEWRKSFIDTPILRGESFEKQAVNFVLSNQHRVHDKDVGYRTIEIGGKPATEVWYYYKTVPAWTDDEGEPRASIVVTRLKHHDEVFAKSVIAPLAELENSCAAESIRKQGFLNAMYALFNTAPLQAGNGEVGRVFMAATYENIFGKPLMLMKKFANVELDASTLTADDFAKKYRPLL
jgi:hypothetical protein